MNELLKETRARIRAIVAGRIPSVKDHLADDTLPLGSGGLGLDSIQIVEILMLIEEDLGVTFPENWDPEGELTIEALAGFALRQSRDE